MRHSARLSLLLLAAWAPVGTHAEPLSDGLQRCAREADGQLRLKCFDELAASVPQLKRDQFGMTAAIAQQRAPSVAKRPLIEPDVLGARIAELRQGSHGEYIFTLDNGQIWAEQESRPGERFAVGESVQIRHGAMSSLWLSASSHRLTRVKRIT